MPFDTSFGCSLIPPRPMPSKALPLTNWEGLRRQWRPIRRRLGLKPDDALICCNLGLAYGELGRHDEAMDVVKKAIRLKPDFAFAHYELGWLYSQKEQWREAVQSYLQATVIEPEFVKAHFNLSLCYLMLGSLGQARDEYEILLRLDKRRAQQLYDIINK